MSISAFRSFRSKSIALVVFSSFPSVRLSFIFFRVGQLLLMYSSSLSFASSGLLLLLIRLVIFSRTLASSFSAACVVRSASTTFRKFCWLFLSLP